MIESKTVQIARDATVSFEAEYFRSYGVHTVTDDKGDIHIFSFPDWWDLQSALTNDLPTDGTVVTTECATFTVPHEELAASAGLIEERQEFVRQQSKATKAEIWLGTPKVPLTEWDDWRNSVVTVAAGKVLAVTDKVLLSAYEQAHSPLKAAPRDEERYTSPLGRSAIICSDIILSSSLAYNGSVWPGETLLIPTCWAAVPNDSGWDRVRAGWIKKHGSADNYFKNGLERCVASAFSASLAQTIVVSDRNVPSSAVGGPFNAVFRRAAED